MSVRLSFCIHQQAPIKGEEGIFKAAYRLTKEADALTHMIQHNFSTNCAITQTHKHFKVIFVNPYCDLISY